eukprot:1840738-Pyramimonas_sp.AAC.1
MVVVPAATPVSTEPVTLAMAGALDAKVTPVRHVASTATLIRLVPPNVEVRNISLSWYFVTVVVQVDVSTRFSVTSSMVSTLVSGYHTVTEGETVKPS